MVTINYKIEFFTDWNCSSGLTGNADIDIAALRDKDGFPYIPGKTIKGLLRDAARNLAETNEDEIFGSPEETVDKTEMKKAYFSSAEICKDLRNALKNKEEKKQYLFREIASTKIAKETGVAEDKSLRKIEVVIPLTLFGTIECEEEHRKTLVDCMGFVKRLGLNRNRGLGRCEISEVK